MFIQFTKQKFNYHKGQLTPFFIVLIVALVIASLVTINIGKVALNKTYSANASDAGALAGASVMASVFNNIAVANSEMIVMYDEYMATTSIVTAIALIGGLLASNVLTGVASLIDISSIPLLFSDPCQVITNLETAVSTIASGAASAVRALNTIFIPAIAGLLVAVTAFSIAQLFQYNIIRQMAEKGRESALDTAYRYFFSNSGISQRLRSDQRDAFSNYLKYAGKSNLSNIDSIFAAFSTILQPVAFLTAKSGFSNCYGRIYNWQDSWNNAHFVHGLVRINEVDKFVLQTTLMPYPLQAAILGSMLSYASLLSTAFAANGGEHEAIKLGSVGIACGCFNCCGPGLGILCCICWIAAAAAASVQILMALFTLIMLSTFGMFALYAMLAMVWVGNIPGGTTVSTSGFDASWATICWIDDIIHDRMVYVLSDQFHQGTDLGLWQEKYPPPVSFTIANFQGKGKIFPPTPYHDASIIMTDFSVLGTLLSGQNK